MNPKKIGDCDVCGEELISVYNGSSAFCTCGHVYIREDHQFSFNF